MAEQTQAALALAWWQEVCARGNADPRYAHLTVAAVMEGHGGDPLPGERNTWVFDDFSAVEWGAGQHQLVARHR